jgi:hypothetical protein
MIFDRKKRGESIRILYLLRETRITILIRVAHYALRILSRVRIKEVRC